MQTLSYIWAKVIGFLEQRFTAVAVSAMLDDAEFIELSDTSLVIYSPSDFRREAILRTYKASIEEILRDNFDLKVTLEVWDDTERNSHARSKNTRSLWTCNPQFNFSSFVAGDSNQVPLRAAMQVAQKPGNSLYNPLYLYGPPGVGKTHLIYSIANSIAQTYPNANIVCVKADQFTNELVQAIMYRTTAAFKEKYRNADILLVDDVQFIAGKESTQEEFFHTFNYLYELGKQIVLTSDRAPGDMATLEERLKSRFGWGVMVEIKPPDKETRIEIIKAKAAALSLHFSDEVLQYLADTLCDNVRQIEGALRKLRAFRELSGMAMTKENIAKTIRDMQTGENPSVATPELIIRYVCRYYGVEDYQIKGRQRSKNISEPRQVAMYLMRQKSKMSLDDIGKYFGRDHSTVKYAVDTIEKEVQSPGDIKNKLLDIVGNIEANI